MGKRNGGQGSAKTRKKRGHGRSGRYSTTALMVNPAAIGEIRSLVVKAGLLVEYTLPEGKCTAADVFLLRDVYNLAASLSSPDLAKATNPEYFDAYTQELLDLDKNFGDFFRRFIDGENFCTPAECEAIRTGFSVINDIIMAELDSEPGWVVRAFFGIRKDIGEDVIGGVGLESAMLRARQSMLVVK